MTMKKREDSLNALSSVFARSLVHPTPERGERQRTEQRCEDPADAEAAEVDMPVGGGEVEGGD